MINYKFVWLRLHWSFIYWWGSCRISAALWTLEASLLAWPSLTLELAFFKIQWSAFLMIRELPQIILSTDTVYGWLALRIQMLITFTSFSKRSNCKWKSYDLLNEGREGWCTIVLVWRHTRIDAPLRGGVHMQRIRMTVGLPLSSDSPGKIYSK